MLESIHAFGASTLGSRSSGSARRADRRLADARSVAARRPAVPGAPGLDLSRETVFVLNNLVLVGLRLVILWGTFFPLISERAPARGRRSGRPGSPLHGSARDRARVAVRHRADSCRGGERAQKPAAATSRPGRRGGSRDAAGLLVRPVSGSPRRWRCSSRRRSRSRPSVRSSGAAAGAPRRDRRAAGRSRSAAWSAETGADTAATLVHVGMAGAVRRGRRLVGLPGRTRRAPRPGQIVRVGGYDIRYERHRRTEPREALARGLLTGQQGRARRGDAGTEPWLLPVSDAGPSDRSAGGSKARRRVRWA